MNRIKAVELPFYEELFNLTEAMQYSLSDYHKVTENSSEYAKQNHQYWLNELESILNKKTYNEIKAYYFDHPELVSNPLLDGLLKMYLQAFEAKNEQEYKQVYENYQNVQRSYDFKNNMELYIEMGCVLSTGYLENTGKIKLTYPLTLYTAYTMNGGRDDDYRGGFLYPEHELTDEEVMQLHSNHPELFKSEKIAAIYNKIKERLYQTKNHAQPGNE